MNFGMYLTRKFLSACTLFPAKGHSFFGVCRETNSNSFSSVSSSEILDVLEASVSPDYNN